MYVLDTNACTRLLNNTSPALVQRLCRCDPSHIHLSSVVKAELLYGARHSARVSENLQLLERFSARFTSLPFDDQCAEQCGLIRTDLAARGRLIGPNDLVPETPAAHPRCSSANPQSSIGSRGHQSRAIPEKPPPGHGCALTLQRR